MIDPPSCDKSLLITCPLQLGPPVTIISPDGIVGAKGADWGDGFSSSTTAKPELSADAIFLIENPFRCVPPSPDPPSVPPSPGPMSSTHFSSKRTSNRSCWSFGTQYESVMPILDGTAETFPFRLTIRIIQRTHA